MIDGITIRPEKRADIATIYDLTARAFSPKAFSDGTEQECINMLRADGDLTVSLVAEDKSGIVGHAAFSPAFINGEHNGWYALGPISVELESQGTGIGGALIKTGLMKLRELGARGCVLTGDPNYYSRHGFKSDGRLTYRGTNPAAVQWISFSDDIPTGEVTFSPGLEPS